MFKKFNKKLSTLILIIISAFSVSAHEAYVVETAKFWNYLSQPTSWHAFDALKNPHDLHITIAIVSSVLIVFLANFFFRLTKKGQKIHNYLEKLYFLGPLFVRAAISASFFFSALSWSFLGPELTLHQMIWPSILRAGLFTASILIALGLFTELAALIGLVIFSIGLATFGLYVTTYFNYLGEIIVLLLFGMRKWSVDKYLFGPLKHFKNWREYETTIVRIFYGVALIYAAITVKFLHPALTVYVVEKWHLTQFHWLFPSDPLLVTMGAGIAEFAIGFFIMVGFEMRFTVLVSLFYITLSLIYFHELVWPHLMLYGISLNLIVQPEVFTLDHLLFRKHRKRWWLRPFKAHGSKE